ncbi:hypothetical protein WJX72_011959 [[Myrmecia] bisecta]|uniref:N-acetyltransferase domain-containing protein n=1 Tax=[Myrmecia] bisecta TaxID=41462 RepID=A0AAW1QGQ3_9CHLO
MLSSVATAPQAERVIIAAWDVGAPRCTKFISHHSKFCPNQGQGPEGRTCCDDLLAPWSLAREPQDEASSTTIAVMAGGRKIGRVNRRAAVMLAPLLDGGLIEAEFRQNQGQPTRSIYIYAKMGLGSHFQVVREPANDDERRAYLGVLAGAMDAFLAFDRELLEDSSLPAAPPPPDMRRSGSWPGNKRLPGALEWDYATGSEGNTVSRALVDALGRRVFASLQQSGAPKAEHNMPGKLKVAKTDAEVSKCFPVLSQLRPHVTSAQDLLSRVKRQQEQGYSIVFVEDGGKVKGCAGFRVTESLYAGKRLYVDDLVVDKEARSGGYGAQLMEWLMENARLLGCDGLALDSGVQRGPAHKFYFNQGLEIKAYHFAMAFEDAESDDASEDAVNEET